MKRVVIASVLLAGCLCACNSSDDNGVKNPIQMSSPQPKEQITKVNLTNAEAAMVNAGNELTFRILPLLREGNKSLLFSPLSLQYALGMTANGASGETLSEITDALGFGDDLDALNSLCNKLLMQLPAVDLGVKLRLVDAILVSDQYPLLPSFKEKVESTYYAAVENASFADPATVAARINDWSKRNTGGLIDRMLEPQDISPDDIAFLMNALYFKAPWMKEGNEPLFKEESTRNQAFYAGGCDVIEVPTMHTSRRLNYADFGNFRVLEIPYANGSFAMYILLPEGEYVGDLPDNVPEKYTFDCLMRDFTKLDWQSIRSSLKECDIELSLPKFETSSSFRLNEALGRLGMQRAFTPDAQFDRMFQDPNLEAYIDYVIQKARISVAEWGTEAAAVTVVAMAKNTAFPGESPVEFICDHPFAYLIAEKGSGAILFAGAYFGK